MTRIETPVAAPINDKPADKTVGKAAPKDADSRQAAFRSLLRQLGTQEKAAKGTLASEDKMLPGGGAKRGLPSAHNRAESKDDRTTEIPPEINAAPLNAECSDGSERVAAWQTILGNGATSQSEQPTSTTDLAALASARGRDGDLSCEMPEKIDRALGDRLGRPANTAMPSSSDLNLIRSNAVAPATTEAADPFAALSSLLNRTTDSASEPETMDIAPIKMSVVNRETHFEPVARLSPVQQIATVVGEEIVTISETTSTQAASQTTEPSRHSTGPLKVLHLKLEPEDLGAVVLKMRLVDKSLELEVVASRQETADLLAKDRDALTRALHSSGYSADVVSITTSTTSDNSQMTGDNRAGSQPSSGQSGAQAGGNRSSNEPGNGDRQPARPQTVEGVAHEESGADRSGGDLYL